MKNEQTEVSTKVACASNSPWVSPNSHDDEEIVQEAREFLNDLEKSRKNKVVVVGWKPD